MLDWKIVTMAIKPDNMVFKKTAASEGTLVIIDNIGNSDFIPVCNYVAFVAIRKIGRKWRRFEHSLAQDFSRNRELQQMLRNLKPSN